MFDRVRNHLDPPVFEGDEEKTRIANLLHTMLLLTLMLGVIFVPLGALVEGSQAGALALVGVFVALTPVMLFMVRRGHVRLVSVLLVSLLFVVAVGSVTVVGSIRAPIASTFVLCVAVAGLLVGYWATISVTLLSLIALLGLWWAETTGLLPPYAYHTTGFAPWLTHAAVLVSTALLLVQATRGLNHALERVYSSRQSLAQTNRALTAEIAERKQAEKALRESEERFRSVFENAVMGLYRTTPDGRPLLANAAWMRMLGCSSFEELAQLDLAAGFAQGYSRSAFKQQIESDGQVIGLEYAWERPDGKIIFVRENARAVRDRDGNTRYYEGTIEDITEQKRAIEALHKNELRYRALFERTNDAVFILDLEGHHIAANQQAADLLGYTMDEILGLSMAQLVTPSQRQDSQNALTALLAGESLPVYERTLRRKDGAEILVEINAALVYDPAGRPLHIQSIVRDITERKRAETEREQLLADLIRRSKQLLSAAEVSKSASTMLDLQELIDETVNLIQQGFDFYYVGLFLVDEDGRDAVLRAGTGGAGRAMLAAAHKLAVGGESMVGQCVAHAEARIALDVADVESGEEAARFDNPYLPDTRSEMALPLVSRGQCIGALTVQSIQAAAFSPDDLTTLQSMADQLATAITNARLYDEVQRSAAHLEELVAERTAELADVNRELEAFAYSVSHDLRAPLRSVNGFGQALLEDCGHQLGATGQDYVQRMRAASQRMGQLIDDLLRLSRLTRREVYWEPVDLSALAATVAADLRAAQPERQVEFDIAEGILAQGDEHLLQAMLENLLGNAWKFTSKQPTGRIEFSVMDSDGEPLYFVRDNGAGFDMTYADRLFAPFQRLHGLAEFEGSGVGLATVQRIVHRHGGRVWAEGAEGQGATFFFTLPSKGGESSEGKGHPAGRRQS